MNILVLGGCLPPDVPQGESFAERVAQYLADAHACPVVLDLATLSDGADVLHESRRPPLPLRLADYDLILLSIEPIQRPNTWGGSVKRMWQLGTQARQLFGMLAVHRRRVLVLSPMPCLPLVLNGFHRWASYRLRALCRRYAFRLVDGFGALPRQEFVFAPDGQTLNRFGHHYLALGLIEVLDQEAVGSAAVVQ